ncbi:MAG: hypothetical protein JW904_09675 [Spirochaetales bacterium]|nr:hypothetical protein [Spirochaetales bacterium]
MKKGLILFIMLVAVSNLLIAEAGVGTWGRTIFNVAQGDEASSDITQSWGPGWGNPGPRQGIDAWFKGDFVEFYFKYQFNGAQLVVDDEFGDITNMYGVLKLMPSLLTAYIGKWAGDGLDMFRKTSPHPIYDVNNGNVGRMGGMGVWIVLAPADTGFEAAVNWRTNGFAPTETIQDNMTLTGLAAAYTVPDMLKFTLGSTASGDDPTAEVRNIFGRVELLMVPDLVLWADVKYTGLETATDTGIDSVLAAGYKMDALSIAFAATLGMNLDTEVTTWNAAPEVYYDLGAVTVGLYASVAGSSEADTGLAITAEPYVKIDDFDLRISFKLTMNGDLNTTTDDYDWAVPILINFGF